MIKQFFLSSKVNRTLGSYTLSNDYEETFIFLLKERPQQYLLITTDQKQEMSL